MRLELKSELLAGDHDDVVVDVVVVGVDDVGVGTAAFQDLSEYNGDDRNGERRKVELISLRNESIDDNAEEDDEVWGGWDGSTTTTSK